MTKADVIRRMGQPYKIAVRNDDHGNNIEVLYYKETLFPKKAANGYDIESLLNFKKDILISIKQGEEKKTGGEINVINKL